MFDADTGLIVTNAHVVNGGETFTVELEDEPPRSATLLAAAPCEDLAVLRVDDTEGLSAFAVGSQDDLQQGETVVVVGFPGSANAEGDLTATRGVVLVVETTFDLEDAFDVPLYRNIIQTDAAINPGNSGGPLVNTSGEVVGVNSAGITLLGDRIFQGQGLAIGANRLDEVLPGLLDGESLAWTGMSWVYPQGPADVASLDLPDDQPGLVVVGAVPGSNAADAGFGDEPVLITAVNGEPIRNTLNSYCAAAGGTPAGEQMTFTVFQPGDATPQDVRVTVEDAAG